jgi:hypothetical protein
MTLNPPEEQLNLPIVFVSPAQAFGQVVLVRVELLWSSLRYNKNGETVLRLRVTV